jgi:hypothetical protein
MKISRITAVGAFILFGLIQSYSMYESGSSLETPAQARAAAMQNSPAVNSKPSQIAFRRYIDQTEGAFLVLVPQGWSTRGGMVRVNPLTAVGGVGQAMEAKIDFAIMREPAALAYLRWLPKIRYAQPSQGNAMLNGNWNGMPIVAMLSPQNYITRILFPQLHPKASDVKVLSTQPRPDLAASIRMLPEAQALLSKGIPYQADAASVQISYQEQGARFKEIIFTAIEGYSFMGAGLWNNSFTMAARAPESEYDSYGPLTKVIINSFSLNPRWLAAELQGQIQRGQLIQNTLKDIAKVDAEIASQRAKTMAQINDQEYLVLTGQERYLNPHTGNEELGSNEWKYRWENASGEIIYTDEGNWDPNLDPNLKVSGYKRSAVKISK